ncbi:hypothetical protein HAHE_04080 [Haloferula helveola]|uniref:DUF1592 domain-containing protein n=1 Tax=Haloferula helveola TaxID=490095 RepID=A0ABN6GZ43_9BACT|nr:hypothetical protein HAHE_04080 [Haloferula helveola]
MRPLLVIALAIAAKADDFATKAVPFLEKHCYECHGANDPEGGVEVHGLTSTDSAFRHHEFLDKIAEAVRWEDMPPEEDVDELPSEDERKVFLAEIDRVRKKLAKGDFPRKAGRPTIRRLNRDEYSYTVRDLFGVDFLAGQGFPADGAGGSGFNNTGDALFVPPVLLEKYLGASRKVVKSLYGSPKDLDKILLSRPDDKKPPEQAARENLTIHGSLAFRRRITDEETDRFIKLFKTAKERGDSFEEAMRAPLQALLVHPSFLFRVEHDEPGKAEWRLNDFELAVRLSYFLWASMPDRELFRLADEGKLSQPEVLRQQTLRMLDDPRIEFFARHFGGQWLGFDELRETANPDTDRYPEFTPSLRVAMYRESVDFLKHVIRNNRPVLELIDADYTFLNSELARLYGVPGVSGDEMRMVRLKDRNRGGVIGQASILTATSMPLRTSPVKRGVWILDNLLGTPPPPPPQNAGVLPADDRSAEGLSFRKQLELHRDKAGCSGCHSKIDPLGFGLENFDAIGRWRDKDVNGQPVDSLAVMPGDITFSTPAELKDLLLTSDDLFLKNIARRMLSYALGRQLEYYDEPVITELVDRLRKDKLKARSLVLAIVESHPFQHRSATR